MAIKRCQVQTLPPAPRQDSELICEGAGGCWKTPGRVRWLPSALESHRVLKIQVSPGIGQGVGLDGGCPCLGSLSCILLSEGAQRWALQGLGANPGPAMSLTGKGWASPPSLYLSFPICKMGREEMLSEAPLRADVLRSGSKVVGVCAVCMLEVGLMGLCQGGLGLPHSTPKLPGMFLVAPGLAAPGTREAELKSWEDWAGRVGS